MELLEKLTIIFDCMYLSNLPRKLTLSSKQRTLIEKINPEIYSLEEWQIAINYIIGGENKITTINDAKKLLLNYYKK